MLPNLPEPRTQVKLIKSSCAFSSTFVTSLWTYGEIAPLTETLSHFDRYRPPTFLLLPNFSNLLLYQERQYTILRYRSPSPEEAKFC
jgi:hypothetical protein